MLSVHFSFQIITDVSSTGIRAYLSPTNSFGSSVLIFTTLGARSASGYRRGEKYRSTHRDDLDVVKKSS